MMYEARGFSDSRPIQKAGSVVKWSVLLLCTAALLSGCDDEDEDDGGDSGSSNSSYEVSTTTGTGGSIDPSSVTVASEETAEFTVTPDRGYKINTVTGCNVGRSGITYTTGPITKNCEVSVTFAATPNPNTLVLAAGRYEIIGTDSGVHGGIVKDLETNLEWMRCSIGKTWDGNACTGNASSHTWDEAQTQAESTSYGGHSDWRVPTDEELQTLVYCSGGDPEYFHASGSGCDGSYDSPTIVTEAFPNTPPSVFWSASPYAGASGDALSVDFGDGNTKYGSKSLSAHVRLVRDAD